MKRLSILIVLFALHQELLAQIPTGSLVATGSLGYSQSNKSGKDNLKDVTYSYHISPRLGYMVADNFEAGLFGSLRRRVEEYDGRMLSERREYGESKSIEKAIGVYLRKYLFLTDKVAFSGTGEVSYNSFRSTSETYAEDIGPRRLQHENRYKTSSFVASVRPGFSFFLSEKIALNATYGALSYSTESLEYSDWQHHYPQTPHQSGEDRKSHNLKLDLSSASSSLGLSYFF